MNKKNYISVFTFLVFFIIGFIYLNKVFTSTHRYINTINDYKKLLKNTNIDVLIYGNSHAFTAFNPVIIDEKCKTISYNLSSDAQRLPVSEMVLEESLKYNTPKLIVLEVHINSMKYPLLKSDLGHQLRAFDYVSNFSNKKLETYFDIYNKNFLEVYFQLFRNHAKWSNNNYFNTDREENVFLQKYFYSKGYFGFYKVLDNREKAKYNSLKNKILNLIPEKKIINKYEISNLFDFIKIAKKNKIEILVITSPHLQNQFENHYLRKMCDSVNVPYLNFNDFYNKMNLKLKDFSDSGHLNISGSIKASSFLANYINENYSLPDKSSNEVWKLSKENYTYFKENYFGNKDEIFKKKLNFELTKSIKLIDATIIRNNKKYVVTLNFDNSKQFIKMFHNYKLGIHIIPEKSDLEFLNFESKSIKRNFEIANIRLDRSYKATSTFSFYTKIKNLKAIRLFLYDKKGYKGVLGKPISITNISFK